MFLLSAKKISDYKTLRKNYPDLWKKMLYMDSQIPNNRGFRGYATVQDMENRFAQEDKQLELWAA